MKKKSTYFKITLCAILMFGLSSLGLAQNATTTETPPDTIPPGHQGAVNPMTENVPPMTGDELLDASFPASWPLFGTGIRMRIGGYVKADFIRDLDYVGDPYEFELGSIAVDGTPERDLGGRTTFHVKESRVNFDVRYNAKKKNGKEFPMQIFVEIDWFFDSPSMVLNTRLRHAYGVIGRILVGRFWTTSADLTAIPGLIDFSGGDGLYGARVTQIRWQDKIGNRFQYAVALEEPSSMIDNPDTIAGGYRPAWPNLAGMIRYKAEKGSTIQLGVDLIPTSWRGAPSTISSTNAVGYAVTLMSRIIFKVSKYHDSFLWGGGYGQGQGHKIVALEWDGKASGSIAPTGLDLNPSWFAYAGVNHYWSNRLNSTIATHWTGTELSPLQMNNTIKKAGSFHVNLIWFPYKYISTGIEYMWGMRENKDGTTGNASRIQFMAKFKFN